MNELGVSRPTATSYLEKLSAEPELPLEKMLKGATTITSMYPLYNSCREPTRKSDKPKRASRGTPFPLIIR